MPNLLINGNGAKTRKLIEIEQAILESQRKLTSVETTNEILRKRIEQLENQGKSFSETLGNLTERVSYIEKKTKIHKPHYEKSR